MSVFGLSRSLSQKFWNFSRNWAQVSYRAFTSQTEEQRPEDEFHLNYLDGERKGIAVFSFRRFRTKNALGRNIVKMFHEAIEEVKYNNQIRVVVLRSEVPGVFCAGADLKERIHMTNQEVAAFLNSARNTIVELGNLPMPTIAAIDGAALGGGLEISLACDMRIAAANAKIGLPETSLAIIPGGGGTQRLPRTIGISKAKELIFTSRALDGKQSEEMGVVNYCVDQNDAGDAAYERALELADEIVPQGPIALRMAKAAISRGSEVDLDSGLKFEEACYAQVIPTKDRMEGLKAFKEKRRPKYEGH